SVAGRKHLEVAVGICAHDGVADVSVLRGLGWVGVEPVPRLAQRRPVAPSHVGGDLPDVPQGIVCAHREQLLATILVPPDGDPVRAPQSRGELSQLLPGAPATVGDGLPGLPDLPITADAEQLLPAVAISPDGELARQANLAGRPAAPEPLAPATVARGLPLLPEGAVFADDKQLLAAVGVGAHHVRRGADVWGRGVLTEPAVRPGPVGSHLPEVEDSTSADDEDLE